MMAIANHHFRNFELLYREKLLSALLTHNGTQEIQNFLINKVRLLVANDLAERLGKENLSQLEKEYSSIYFHTPSSVSYRYGLKMVSKNLLNI